jgi:multisubunit Na+/H+ antiporter MnhC subunit
VPHDRTLTIALMVLSVAVVVAGLLVAYARQRGTPSPEERQRARQTLSYAVLFAIILALLAVFLPRLGH